MRSAVRVGSLLLVTLLLGLLATPLIGPALGRTQTATSLSASATACTSNVTVEAYDALTWSIAAIENICPTATFTVENTGTTAHTFTVSSLVNQSDPSSTSTTFFSAPNLLYNQPLNGTGSGVSVLHATIHFPTTPGSYEFTCLYHYASGMYGEIYVDEPAPSTSPAIPSFEPFWYITVTITALAVLTIVLGLVYGKRSPHHMGIPKDAPITSRPEYYNDSRPEPLDSAEPTLRGGEEH